MASSITSNQFMRCLRPKSARSQHLRLFSAYTTRADAEVVLQSKPESRKRREILKLPSSHPFEQLPYQCFQEARKVLLADREEKILRIEEQRRRIARAEAKSVEEYDGAYAKKGKLVAMNRQLEKLKIYADINDPLIKKRFEDGKGDFSRPVYRFLAEKKWRSYKYKILVQRIQQFYIVPDLLQKLDPVVDISMSFGGKTVQPGDFVRSDASERAPNLTIQGFDRGERLVTIVVVDADVPNPFQDKFDHRCHFLAKDIRISPTEPHVLLHKLSESQVVLPWMPPHAQKGSPYHRLAVFVLQQHEDKPIDVKIGRKQKPAEESLNEVEEESAEGEINEDAHKIEDAKESSKSGDAESFNLRSLADRHRLKPIGATLFRIEWDEATKDVMARAGLEGSNIELKRKQPEALPWKYKVKNGDRYR